MAAKHIEKIMVMGAGAVGGFFGGKLGMLPGIRLSLVARGKHLDAIQRHGLAVESMDGPFIVDAPAAEDPSELPQPDLILLAVKTFDTGGAIKQIRPVVSSDTLILTLQNGLENRLMLEEAFGKDQLIPGVCRIGARITKPGHISHTDPASVVIGTPEGVDHSPADEICALFEQADVPCRQTDDIVREIWIKFAWNAIFNMLTAAENCTVDAFYEDNQPDSRLCSLADEILIVAKAENVNLHRDDLEKIIERSADLEGFITSTLHDRRKGKPLEFDAFTGAMLRLGVKHELDLPEFRKLHQRLEAL